MRRLAVSILAVFLVWGAYRYQVSSRKDASVENQGDDHVISSSERRPNRNIFMPHHDQLSGATEQNPSATPHAPSGDPEGKLKSPPRPVSVTSIDNPSGASTSRNLKPTSVAKNGLSGTPDSRGIVIEPKDAKGAVFALYQAILWREPDQAGGASAVDAFSRIGWKTYMENAKNMIASTEFFERIAPNHSAEAIINRMYAIFLNRCASAHEMQDHMGSLRDNETGNITDSILNKAIDENKQKIFEGGYKANSCPSF